MLLPEEAARPAALRRRAEGAARRSRAPRRAVPDLRLDGLAAHFADRRRLARPALAAALRCRSKARAESRVPTARRKIVVVLKGYPRLSETFIAQELLGLERAGIDSRSSRCGGRPMRKRHPVHDEIKAPVALSAGISPRGAAARAARAWLAGCGKPGFWRRSARSARDLRRDPTPQPHPPLRPGAGAGRRMAAETAHGCMRISSTRRRRSPAMPACSLGIALDLLGACQGHLDLAGLGACAKSSRRRAGR